MSIKVTIEHDGGSFMRTLEIERITPTVVEDVKTICTYDVTLSNGSRVLRQTGFPHRYGDDVLTLVAEAVDALGGRGGPLTTGLKR